MTYELMPTTSITTHVDAGITSTTSTIRPFLSAMIKADFVYAASAATTVKAWVQCSADRGTTWHDVVNFAFTTASLVRYVNLSGMTVQGTPTALTDHTASDNTSTDDTLTTVFRVYYITTGTYGAGTTLKVWMVTRDSA
jgi:hypothetical protein